VIMMMKASNCSALRMARVLYSSSSAITPELARFATWRDQRDCNRRAVLLLHALPGQGAKVADTCAL
jgi:hypothetical protein